MMKDIAIYGAGGFGREIACLLRAINRVTPQWNFIGFFDDICEIGSKNAYGRVIGGIAELNNYPKPLSLIMGIGSSTVAYLIVQKIINPLVAFPNIIAPDALFMDRESLCLGKGNVIGFRSVISCNINIGDFNHFNIDTILGHDVCMGSYNTFNPSVRVSGCVSIGNKNLFGVGSIVLQGKKIGNNTVIGANSVIIRNTKDNQTYIGNPAHKLEF